MKRFVHTTLKRFGSDTDGATLTELAIVLPTLLLLVLGALEFGRLGYSEAMAQKATDIAARTASVRPAVCAGVPDEFGPITDTSGSPPRFGTMCRMTGVCAPVPERTCTLSDEGSDTELMTMTKTEMWQTIAPLLPGNADRENVQIRYTFDERLGFLGGPYIPIVTAELVGLEFQFVTPLGALASLASGGGDSEISNSITFPNMSASLPAEDLGQGTR
jgi:hypothetical protein